MQRFTLVTGIILVLIGLSGFIPREVDLIIRTDSATEYYALLFNLFMVNTIFNVTQISFGIWGILASNNNFNSQQFCKVNSVFYIILGLFGILTPLNSTFVLMPFQNNNIWLHAIIAASCAYVGWSKLKTASPMEEKYSRAA